MIVTDQPTIFDDSVVVAFSSKNDGSMRDGGGRHSEQSELHRRGFLQKIGIEYESTVFQVMSYAPGATYNTYAFVDTRATLEHEPMGIQADAIITASSGVAIMLPVADCNAVAVYDPVRRVLASLHVGRHNSITDLVHRVIGAMQRDFGCQAADLRAWLSPSVKRQSYIMEYFHQEHESDWQDYIDKTANGIHLDIAGHTVMQLIRSGIAEDHIQVCPEDTATNEEYFCHSQGDKNGRMVMVAMIRQGEPAA